MLNNIKIILINYIILVLVRMDLSFQYTSDQNQECIFEYNSNTISQGQVYSPNYPNSYPNNLNCRYEFNARDNERVILRVEDFQLEPAQNTAVNDINFIDLIDLTVTRAGTYKKQSYTTESDNEYNSQVNLNDDLRRQCFYDFLDVFTSDGHGRIIWRSRHCGSKIDEQIVSTSPRLILVFNTDRMLGFRGFKIHFHFSYLNILPFVTDDLCGPSEIIGNGSILASPNYPLMFPNNIECAWTITVEKEQNILIKFIDVNLNQPCQHSQLAIWDGYVTDVNKPDFLVCEKLNYYHKNMLQFKSKSNRIVLKFMGNKQTNINNNNNLNNKNNLDNYLNNKLKQNGSQIIVERLNKQKIKIKNGFFLSWNGIRLADDCDQDFQCKGGEYCIDSKNFLCQQTYRYCISKKLVCDGVYNCDTGDESDERHCELSFLKSKLYLSIAIVSTILFILLTILFVMIHYININKKKSIIKHDLNYADMKYDPKTEFNFSKSKNIKKILTNSTAGIQIEYEDMPKNFKNVTVSTLKSKSSPVQIYTYNLNEDTDLLDKSNELLDESNRLSIPTDSSSIQSVSRTNSHIKLPEELINNNNNNNKNNFNRHSNNKTNDLSVSFKNTKQYNLNLNVLDEESKNFRRNSYTKAIFYENNFNSNSNNSNNG